MRSPPPPAGASGDGDGAWTCEHDSGADRIRLRHDGTIIKSDVTAFWSLAQCNAEAQTRNGGSSDADVQIQSQQVSSQQNAQQDIQVNSKQPIPFQQQVPAQEQTEMNGGSDPEANWRSSWNHEHPGDWQPRFDDDGTLLNGRPGDCGTPERGGKWAKCGPEDATRKAY